MKRVAVIETGLSNVDSVRRAIEEVGGAAHAVRTADELIDPDSIVLPGVGSFSAAMESLRSTGLDVAIREQVERFGIPLLGICLGMQLLMDEGEEGGRCTGLGLVGGRVVRLEPIDPGERVPHVGWNEVVADPADPLFDGIEVGSDFYFVHSYRVAPSDENDVVATTPYCGEFVSVLRRGPVVGVQFHPEKSHQSGLRLLRNFLEI